MRYMGSKGRHAKHIVPILMDGHDQTKPYIEPFLGGGNMFSAVPADIKHGSDTAEFAVALLSALSVGWQPPEVLSEERYKDIKANPSHYSPELVGFAAYSCSYAGKFWGGYARGNDAKGKARNFAGEQRRALLVQAAGLSGGGFSVSSYADLTIPSGSTVYCDPPYANTTGYKGGFDHAPFWAWCEDLVHDGCRLFVSEYTAPNNWASVWSRSTPSSLVKDTGSKVSIERLFTLTPL